jgi:hypothetical protein
MSRLEKFAYKYLSNYTYKKIQKDPTKIKEHFILHDVKKCKNTKIRQVRIV